MNGIIKLNITSDLRPNFIANTCELDALYDAFFGYHNKILYENWTGT